MLGASRMYRHANGFVDFLLNSAPKSTDTSSSCDVHSNKKALNTVHSCELDCGTGSLCTNLIYPLRVHATHVIFFVRAHIAQERICKRIRQRLPTRRMPIAIMLSRCLHHNERMQRHPTTDIGMTRQQNAIPYCKNMHRAMVVSIECDTDSRVSRCQCSCTCSVEFFAAIAAQASS